MQSVKGVHPEQRVSDTDEAYEEVADDFDDAKGEVCGVVVS